MMYKLGKNMLGSLKSIIVKRDFSEVTPTGEILGNLESPSIDEVYIDIVPLTISGWLIVKDNKIRSLSVTLDNGPLILLNYGLKRIDVAETFRGEDGAISSGFSNMLLIPKKRKNKLKISIWATLENEQHILCFVRHIEAKRSYRHTEINYLYQSIKIGWKLFLNGKLPLSPVKWLNGYKNYRNFSLNHSHNSLPKTSKLIFTPKEYYQHWIETNKKTSKMLSLMHTLAKKLDFHGPKISVIVPVYNTPRDFLIEMISSVTNQIYPKWELCLADDNSTQPHVREIIENAAKKDERIRLVFRKKNGHIVEASNSALSMASGDYIALLDHDDLLSSDALLHVAKCVVENTKIDWVYTDEDKIDDKGNRFDPQFKGGWSPEMAITHNYTHHLTVIRKKIVEQAGAFFKGFEGAQDLDLFLRVSEIVDPSCIKHIPYVCYHWRSHKGSTALNGAQKDYIFESAERCINASLYRRGLQAKPFLPGIAKNHDMCLFQLRWSSDLLAINPVTIVIPTKDRADLLKRCVSSLVKTVDKRYVKLIIIDDQSKEEKTIKYLQEIENKKVLGCKVIRPLFNDSFNYARLINEGSKHVETPYMLQLNNDIEAIHPGWLEDMVGWMSIKGVGVVGAKLIYPDKNIQHAGVVIGPHGGLADHQFHGIANNKVSYLALLHSARNVSAVTGACLLTSKKIYNKMGGFNDKDFSVEYNDVDFCLRVIKYGKRIVYTPQATMIHLTSVSRGKSYNPDEHVNFVKKYKGYVDPFFSRHLNMDDMLMSVNPNHFGYGSCTNRLKILIISHNLNLGGAPIVAYELTKYFSNKMGFDAIVISPSDGDVRKKYKEIGVPVHILDDFPSMENLAASEVSDYLHSVGLKFLSKVDLVVSNTLDCFWGIKMAHMFGIPSIWHIHESVSIESYFSSFREPDTVKIVKDCFEEADKVVFQSNTTRAMFNELENANNFTTIPGGLPLEEISIYQVSHNKEMMREKHGVDLEAKVVTIIGTTCERKGQHIFIEAIEIMKRQYSNGIPNNIKFIIVGAVGGGYLDSLQETVSKYDLTEVIFYNEVEDIYDFFILSDIFVCASFSESFPMVLLLAMAFSLPIVSTNVFGISEMIVNNHEGSLVHAGDPQALSSAIFNCLENPEHSDWMARNAYAKLNRLYDNEYLMQKNLSIVQQISVSREMDRCE